MCPRARSSSFALRYTSCLTLSTPVRRPERWSSGVYVASVNDRACSARLVRSRKRNGMRTFVTRENLRHQRANVAHVCAAFITNISVQVAGPCDVNILAQKARRSGVESERRCTSLVTKVSCFYGINGCRPREVSRIRRRPSTAPVRACRPLCIRVRVQSAPSLRLTDSLRPA
jgi:hypothetical protein